jgi:AraC-like DNA-binding protein
MSKIWLLDNVQLLYTLSYYFPLLYGPLIFLFTKNFIERMPLNVFSYLHFIPFTLVLGYLLLGNYYENHSLFISLLFHPKWRMFFELFSLILYHAFALHIWSRHQDNLKDHPSGISKQQSKWVHQFILTSFIACALVTVVIYCMYTWFPYHQDIRFGFIVLTFFIYRISFSAWHSPHLFIREPDTNDNATDIISPRNFTIRATRKKYANSGLDKAQMNKMIALLRHSMEKERLFLDADITIEKLASHLHCSRHQLSQALNDGLHKTFYDCINHHRVEEAKILLTDPGRSAHKIASIAYDAGFKSLSTFNEVFKKNTGVTPTEYRKMPFTQLLQQRV